MAASPSIRILRVAPPEGSRHYRKRNGIRRIMTASSQGDPANERVHLNFGFLWSWRALNLTPESALPAAKLPVLYNAVMSACDALDGIKDGVISDPRQCRFDPAALLCKNGDAPSCLTQPQVEAVRKIYAGAQNARTGEHIFPGWVRGSESLPDGTGSWPLTSWIDRNRLGSTSGDIGRLTIRTGIHRRSISTVMSSTRTARFSRVFRVACALVLRVLGISAERAASTCCSAAMIGSSVCPFHVIGNLLSS